MIDTRILGREQTLTRPETPPVAHPAKRVRLILAYKHALLRQGLRLLLASQGDVEILAEAEDASDAVEKAGRLKPDVVLIDMGLPGTGAIEPTRQIRRQSVDTKVLVLTASANDEDIVQVLQSGASGCVLKDGEPGELSLAVQAVHRGGAYLSPSISHKVIGDYLRLAKRREGRGQSDVLSAREREILQLIAEGFTNQQIAGKLCLSVKTVEAHKAHIMRKLGLRNRTELIKHALRRGLISLDAAPAGNES